MELIYFDIILFHPHCCRIVGAMEGGVFRKERIAPAEIFVVFRVAAQIEFIYKPQYRHGTIQNPIALGETESPGNGGILCADPPPESLLFFRGKEGSGIYLILFFMGESDLQIHFPIIRDGFFHLLIHGKEKLRNDGKGIFLF